MTASYRALGLLVTVLAPLACNRADPPANLEALRGEVTALRARARAVAPNDQLPVVGWAESGHLYVALGTETVRTLLVEATKAYLREVRLHVRPDAVATAGDEVRVRVGPIGINAGRWDLSVVVERVDAVLSADSLVLSVVDSTSLAVEVPIEVGDATGQVLLNFSWNANRVAGLVCGDFALSERFSGLVPPSTIQLRGTLELESGPEGTVARPVVSQRIPVSPVPTEESWARVRAILAEQDRLSNCGLALSPERVEERLRELLTRGFTFPLPSQVLQPLPLPTSLVSEVEVAGRRAGVSVEADPPFLTERWLWFGAEIGLEDPEAAPSTSAPAP